MRRWLAAVGAVGLAALAPAADPALAERLHPDLPYRAGEVVWAARYEMARTADDVLFRRLRAGALNTAATAAMRPRVEALLRAEGVRSAPPSHPA